MSQVILEWSPPQAKCEWCWTSFFWGPPDIKYHAPVKIGPLDPGSKYGIHYVSCPKCKNEFEVKTGTIPPAYRKGP